MSHPPRRDPPPPYLTPDDPYELQPVQPEKARNLTAEIVTISMIVAGLVLLGVGIMLWYRDNRPAVPPPPTATATTAATSTQLPVATPLISADTPLPRTAIAVRPTVTPLLTERPVGTDVAATPVASPTETPSLGDTPPVEPGGTPPGTLLVPDVHLPVVSSDEQDEQQVPVTPEGTGPSPVETVQPQDSATKEPQSQVLSLPFLSIQEPSPTPTNTPQPPTPTFAPTPTLTLTLPGVPATGNAVTPTSTPPGTPPGTPIATPTTAPTGLPYMDDDMQARMGGTAEVHIGPSTIYTVTGSLEEGTEISLHGRDRTGEWVLACCIDDDDDDEEEDDRAWVRQAYVIIEGNEAIREPDEEEEEEDFDRNEARWLPTVTPDPELRPLPTITPPPAGDYSLLRYTPDNRGYIAALPNLSTAVRAWSDMQGAGGSFVSPLVVEGSVIYGGSSDGQFYGHDRENGSQRARTAIGTVTAAPAVDDGLIYVLNDTESVFALQNPINEEPIWRVDQIGAPIDGLSGINVYSHTLFINLSGRLTVVGGEEGTILHDLTLPADPLYPAIGGQLLYVIVADSVRAYDALQMIEEDTVNLVWARTGIPSGTVPPVYTARGIESLAELYVASSNNRIYSLDANTGEENWNDDNEEPITGLAVNDDALFISGNDYVKARTRVVPSDDVEPVLWDFRGIGPVLSGPLVSDEYVVVFLQSGNILFLDARTGEQRGNYPTHPALSTSAGAVSFPYVFAPGLDGKLYGYRQSP